MMKKVIGISILFSLGWVAAFSQEKYFTKSANISFYSKAPVENIEAHHKSGTCVLDTKTGNVQFVVLMKGFEFRKALMHEHFNENYIESDKFPKAEFKGQITNNNEIDYTKDGAYTAKVEGKLTVHGETNDVSTEGKISVENGRLLITSEFSVLVSDYKISIPNLVKDNISKTIRITVDGTLEPLKQ